MSFIIRADTDKQKRQGLPEKRAAALRHAGYTLLVFSVLKAAPYIYDVFTGGADVPETRVGASNPGSA